MSIFKQIREQKNWTVYQAARELGVTYSEYERLEKGTTGERYLRYLLKMLKVSGGKMSDIKRLLSQEPGKGSEK